MTFPENAIAASQATNCRYCGMLHERTVCPLVKSIEYHPDGSVKRVEFKTAADWPQVAVQSPLVTGLTPSA